MTKEKLGFYDIPHVKNNPKIWKPKGSQSKQTKKQTTPIKPVDVHRAKKLFKVLAKRKLALDYDELQWSRTLAKLRTPTSTWKGLSQETIDRTIDWFCSNCHRKDVPSIWNARALLDRFGWLRDEMEKDIGPYVELQTDVIQPILDKLTNSRYLEWNQASLESLPAAVQLSYNNYSIFYEPAIKLCKQMVAKVIRNHDGILQLPLKKRKGDLDWLWWAQYAERLGGAATANKLKPWETGLPEPDMFVIWWFEQINEQKANWEAWDGNLLREVWTSDNKLYRKLMRKWSAEIKEESMWDEFVALVNE